MIYMICMSDPPDLDEDLSNLSHLDHELSVRHIWSRSRSIWSMRPNYVIYHDLSNISVRSIWSRSWMIRSICPNYLIDHDPSDLSVRIMWYIMIYLIYLSDLSDLDRIYLIYPSHISDLDHNLCNLSDNVDEDHDLSKVSLRFIRPDLSV